WGSTSGRRGRGAARDRGGGSPSRRGGAAAGRARGGGSSPPPRVGSVRSSVRFLLLLDRDAQAPAAAAPAPAVLRSALLAADEAHARAHLDVVALEQALDEGGQVHPVERAAELARHAVDQLAAGALALGRREVHPVARQGLAERLAHDLLAQEQA